MKNPCPNPMPVLEACRLCLQYHANNGTCPGATSGILQVGWRPCCHESIPVPTAADAAMAELMGTSIYGREAYV